MARSEKQLANLKRGNPETQFKRGRSAVEISQKTAGESEVELRANVKNKP